MGHFYDHLGYLVTLPLECLEVTTPLTMQSASDAFLKFEIGKAEIGKAEIGFQRNLSQCETSMLHSLFENRAQPSQKIPAGTVFRFF